MTSIDTLWSPEMFSSTEPFVLQQHGVGFFFVLFWLSLNHVIACSYSNLKFILFLRFSRNVLISPGTAAVGNVSVSL